jgi:hypothetical protein
MTIRRFAPWLVLAAVLAACAMPVQAPPPRLQLPQAEQALPFEQAPSAPATVPEIVILPALEVPAPTSGYPAKPLEVFELDHMVPAVMPVPTTGSGYPAKPREVFELDHYGQP